MASRSKSGFNSFANMTKVSGGQVSSKAKKVYGCDNCNHMESHAAVKVQLTKPNDIGYHDPLKPAKMPKTGDACPRCNNKSLRLFDSTAEFTRAQELKLLQKNGNIRDLEYQVVYQLHVPSYENTCITVPLCKYITDFTYIELTDTNQEDFIVEDVKGNVVTEVAAMKMKMFELEYGIPVRITQR